MEQTSATIDWAMVRTTMSRRSCAGAAPAMASRIWRRRLRGPLVVNPPTGMAPPNSGAADGRPQPCFLDRFQSVSRMKRTNGQLRIGRIDQHADLDLGRRDGLELHALVGEGPEHGLGDARMAAHPDADDGDLGHVLVDAQLLETDLGLRAAHQIGGASGVP